MDRTVRAVILVITGVGILSVLQSPALVSASDDEHGAPEIEPVDETILLSKGADMNFTCRSHEPIEWTHYASTHNWAPPYGVVDQYEADDPDKPYGAVLMLTNVSAVTVGRYYCVHKKAYNEEEVEELEEGPGEPREDRLDELVANYQATSVYVFVSDPEEPLVPIDLPVFHVNQYESFILPCKPTHPEVEVELYKDLEGDLIDQYKFSFTQGYELEFNRLEDGGSYYCQAKGQPEHRIHLQVTINEHYANDTANATVAGSSSPRYDLTTEDRHTTPPSIANVYPHSENSSHLPLPYPPVSEYLLKPTIHSDTKDHVPLGKRIRLVCRVNIRTGVRFTMEWETPAPQLQDNRIDIRPVKMEPVENVDHREYGSRELIIEKATAADDGTYKCVVKDHNDHTSSHSFKLNVRKTPEDYVFLREENNLNDINVRRTPNGRISPINIVIEYRSFPANISYYWSKDYALEISEENIGMFKGKYEVNRTDSYVKLKINSPMVEDTANYTLHVMAGNAENTRRMGVYVHDKPIVSMNSMFVKSGEDVTFKCRAIGYPRPDISFMFVPCLESPWKNCSIDARKKSSSWDSPSPDSVSERTARTQPSGTGESVVAKSRTYSLNANQPGVVYCRASNSEGDVFTQADLLVSPMEDAVTMKQVRPTTSEVTVGDQLMIICSALVYNHTNEITLELNGRDLQESDGVKMVYSGELYAWQAQLTIDHAAHEHSGDLYCKVKTMENNFETRVFHLEVLNPVAPQLLSGKSNESISVDLHDALQLECDIVGTPKPTIVWMKDDAPIVLEENSNRVQLTNTTLTFEYLKNEDYGTYECRAENKMGTIEKYWKVDMRSTVVRKSLLYATVGLLLLLIIAIVLVSLFYCKKKKEVKAMKEAGIVNFEEGNLGVYNPDLALDEQADLLPYNAEYEFPKDRLKLGKQLGTGAFGVVMKATATRIMVNEDETTVAVKMVKKQTDNEVMRALVSELKIMVHLGQHLNVVNLLGAVTKNIAKRELMVIVEYCRFGNIQNFLLKHRPYFIDQINQETGEIDSSIDKNQLRWSKCGYQYNSQGLKYVNLSFSTNNVNHHPLQHPPAFYHNHIDSGSTQQYVDPKKHLNSKGYVRHSGLQNMAMVDSCNTEVTAMTSVEVEDLNTANSNEPLWRSNYGMDYKGPARSVNTTDLVCWASQIASGMEYLASRKVLHGDLAARNILLCDDNVVKICDFGLARSMYKSDNYKKKGEAPLPFKWLALECISDNVFSTYSDVWAYGIVLWELFSLGKVPYPGMEANQELYNKLRDGYRMDKPQYSNQDIYDIMLNCWNVKPDSRPSFKDLKSRFNAMLPDELRDHYMELNEPYLQMNAEKVERGDTDYLANLGPPEEPAPTAPNYVNGIILPLPPISEIRNEKDYLKMSPTKSDSDEDHFDFTRFNSERHSPTIRNNLDTSPPNGSKRHKKRGLPEEIPMLEGGGGANRLSAVANGFNSDSETEATVGPKPRERTSKHNPEPEYMNVKNHKFGARAGNDEPTGANHEAISNPGYIALSMVDEKRC
ncbi:vascular endothelial growth factor receptor 1-like [Anopheles ziemanni]|uniref:vascular endothelial growth factor receptor 1-like n=1 Tax=Anopheles coustani TaxID=139045 RepID=UPI0026591056|nr:vascular endothelial growth factor receptor 1-like [Anopheles coustani]XP_058166588.1 vascular endothelial growth factor receptor 1-like [Anopheles ziemanni]